MSISSQEVADMVIQNSLDVVTQSSQLSETDVSLAVSIVESLLDSKQAAPEVRGGEHSDLCV